MAVEGWAREDWIGAGGLGRSWAGLKTGSAGNLTTSTLVGMGGAGAAAALGTFIAGSLLRTGMSALRVGAAAVLGTFVAGSGLGAWAMRARLVAGGAGALRLV